MQKQRFNTAGAPWVPELPSKIPSPRPLRVWGWGHRHTCDWWWRVGWTACALGTQPACGRWADTGRKQQDGEDRRIQVGRKDPKCQRSKRTKQEAHCVSRAVLRSSEDLGCSMTRRQTDRHPYTQTWDHECRTPPVSPATNCSCSILVIGPGEEREVGFFFHQIGSKNIPLWRWDAPGLKSIERNLVGGVEMENIGGRALNPQGSRCFIYHLVLSKCCYSPEVPRCIPHPSVFRLRDPVCRKLPCSAHAW